MDHAPTASVALSSPNDRASAMGATGALGTAHGSVGPARLRTYSRPPEFGSKPAMTAGYCRFAKSIPTQGSPGLRIAARGSGARSEVQVRPPSVDPYTRTAPSRKLFEAANRTRESFGSDAMFTSPWGSG